MHEPVHFRVVHRHRRTVSVSEKTVLQGSDPFHDRVQNSAPLMHEKQILHERYPLEGTLALTYDQFPYHRSEDFDLHVAEEFVRGQFGVASFEIAHDIPLALVRNLGARYGLSRFHIVLNRGCKFPPVRQKTIPLLLHAMLIYCTTCNYTRHVQNFNRSVKLPAHVISATHVVALFRRTGLIVS